MIALGWLLKYITFLSTELNAIIDWILQYSIAKPSWGNGNFIANRPWSGNSHLLEDGVGIGKEALQQWLEGKMTSQIEVCF